MCENLFHATRSLIRSQTASERHIAIGNLSRYGTTQKWQFDCNNENLILWKSRKINWKASVTEIYPMGDEDARNIDLTSFEGTDVVKMMIATYGKCGVRVWYIQE